MILLVVFLLGAVSWGQASSSNWSCAGPQPALIGSCGESVSYRYEEIPLSSSRSYRFGVDFNAFRSPAAAVIGEVSL